MNSTAAHLQRRARHLPVGQDYLDAYLDEFTFRFNRRTSGSRGKLFYRLAQQAAQIEPAPFATLVKTQPVGDGGIK